MSHEFVKTTWNNGASPAITAEQLNRIEDAIDESIGAINDLETGKQDELTFDTTPTVNSQNPVTSGGIKQALDVKADLASPTFTGTPKVPTPAESATQQIANVDFVNGITGPIANRVSDVENYTNTLENTVIPGIDESIGNLQDNVDDLESAEDKLAKAISTNEETMTATKNYAVGDLVMVNNQLYRVTSPIASGSTLTPSVNVITTTIGAELDTLEAEVENQIPAVDNTLAVAGAAADAKKTGDELANLKSAIVLKQNKTCNNLIGTQYQALYPVNLTEGMYLTFSTSDGAVIGGTPQTNIAFYDENRNFINYYGFPPTLSSRTVGPLSQDLGRAKYIATIDHAPRVPLMINTGITVLPYEEYFMDAPTVTANVVSLMDNSVSSVYRKDDRDAVYSIRRHYGGNNAPINNAFKALVVSDIHEDVTRAEHMRKLLNSWGADYFNIAINTGDTVSTLYEQDIAWYNTIANNSTIPILNTVGNHDAYQDLTGTLVNKVDVYEKFIAPVAEKTSIVQPTGASTNGLNYYYKDIGGVRVIILDCMYWDANELVWFESVLADAITQGLAVIACSHAPFASTYCNLLESSWNVGWFHRDSTVTNIAAAEAIQGFLTNGGTFICWLMGHIHGDEIETLPNYGDQLVICTNSFSNRGTTVEKNADTIAYNYDSMSYLTVDTVNTSVKLYRIGANVDTAGHKRNGFVWNYSTKTIVTEW